jgi:hypothetical protein
MIPEFGSMSTGVTESREEMFMPLVVALSTLIVGILLAIAPAMLIHDDPTMGIVDSCGDSDVNGGNPA